MCRSGVQDAVVTQVLFVEGTRSLWSVKYLWLSHTRAAGGGVSRHRSRERVLSPVLVFEGLRRDVFRSRGPTLALRWEFPRRFTFYKDSCRAYVTAKTWLSE